LSPLYTADGERGGGGLGTEGVGAEGAIDSLNDPREGLGGRDWGLDAGYGVEVWV